MTRFNWTAVVTAALVAAARGAACGSRSGGFAPSSGGQDSGPTIDSSMDGGVTPDAGEGGSLGDDGGFVQTHDDFPNPIIDQGAPPNSAALFGGADVGTDGPCMYEPEMGSLFPNNWLRLRFRFKTSHQENLFEIRLDVPNEKDPLIVYTTNSGYTLDAQTWKTVSTVGPSAPIQVTIRSATVANGALTGGPWKGTDGNIQIAPVSAGGSVVYWTTSGGTVLKGFKLGDESVVQVLSTGEAKTQCIACHTSTPDGLFVGLTGSPDATDGGALAFVDMRSEDGTGARPAYVTQNAYLLLGRSGQHAPTFSKAHWQTSDYMVLTMYELSTRSEIIWTDLESQSPTQGSGWGILARNSDVNEAASAQFSHDGNSVVYTSATSVTSGVTSNDGRIYTIPYNSKQGGTATPLAGASDPSALQYYPAYSADDKFVAFDKVTAAGSGSTYSNPQAELYVVPAAGGTATRLAANDPPTCTGVTSPGISNSWPKWSPEATSDAKGNTYYWLVFSSLRDPGQTTPAPQLYAAPIVVDANGNVTTYSALYFWNQPETEHNHTPAWDVFQIPAQ